MKVREKCFDCLNRQRFVILCLLEDVELKCGEVSNFTGLSKANVFYHLQILVKNNLVEKTAVQQKNVCRKAGKDSREIVRYKLTGSGVNAIKYFPQTRKGKGL